MRYGIFSDIHSNLEALEATIAAYKNEAIDTYLCVGDVVGYAANPNECIEKVKVLTTVTVAGNHDWAAVGLFPAQYFNPHARQAILWTSQNLSVAGKCFLEGLKLVYKKDELTLVHGTLAHPDEFGYMTTSYTAEESFSLLETKICFVGHTHWLGTFVQDKSGILGFSADTKINIKEGCRYIVNVGSVGQPRDNNPKAAYCIYDTDKNQIEIKRANYDIKTAYKKIIAAGLPEYLGNRLLRGD